MAIEANGKENYAFYEEAAHLPNKRAVFQAIVLLSFKEPNISLFVPWT